MKRSAARDSSSKGQEISNGSTSTTSRATIDLSQRLGMIHTTLMPIFLMVATSNMVIILWYMAAHLDGSWQLLIQYLTQKGLYGGIMGMWSLVHIASPLSIKILSGYVVWAVTLQVILPGPKVTGPVTIKGNIPVYKDNGFFCYVLTMMAFFGITWYCKTNGLPSPSIVYDHFGDFLATVTIFALLLCVVLCIKGLYFPSSSDSGSTGNLIMDYYWGTELYPRIFGVDIKVFTNCRFGMTVWPLLVCIYTLKSYELHGFVDSIWVSSFLHMAYFTKFFWWEAGYMGTIDIMMDRAGYYICWGCLTWVPGFYASTTLWFVNHPIHLGTPISALILLLGLVSLSLNYIADWQKQAARSSNGNCNIWGSKAKFIRAKYTTDDGEQRESLLLVSGWWGVARHFHYVPELALAFTWTVPAMFTHIMPYNYFIFLTILLMHRTFRDDEKCSAKYGKYWDEYCKKVPHKMIPGIF